MDYLPWLCSRYIVMAFDYIITHSVNFIVTAAANILWRPSKSLASAMAPYNFTSALTAHELFATTSSFTNLFLGINIDGLL